MLLLRKAARRVRLLSRVPFAIDDVMRKVEILQTSIGRVELRQLELQNSSDYRVNEFKVFSQWGEDGIIQFLLRYVLVQHHTFVEFGVEDYKESNTRFLLSNNNWTGLVLDGSADNIRQIQHSALAWGHTIDAVHAFITRENINDLLTQHGMQGDIGILSVDIDGNDYWVWEAIDAVSPAIVICEYNSLFGPTRSVVVPYDPAFQRGKAHYSHLYYGASIAALDQLARRKGYALVAGNSAGNNAFFVKQHLAADLPTYTPGEVYVQSKFRESHDPHGHLTYLDFEQRRALIRDLTVLDLDTGEMITVGELDRP